MNKTILGVFIATAVAITSCSSTRETKKADPRAQEYIPERHKNQDENANAPGYQKDRVREDFAK